MTISCPHQTLLDSVGLEQTSLVWFLSVQTCIAQRVIEIQWATILSDSIQVYLYSFCRCCFSNLRNHAKFRENSSLQQFKFIQGHRPWCQSKSEYTTSYYSLIVALDVSRTFSEILTHKARRALMCDRPHCPLTSRFQRTRPNGSIFIHFLWWAPKYVSFLEQNAYRPFKVIQGR